MRKIESVTKDIQGALKTGIADRIKIGKLLIEAREILKEDQKFGEWRSVNFSDQINQKTAHNYMRLAKCFGENLPENIPLSGLYELSEKLNDDYRDGALSILAEQDKVSCRDVVNAINTVSDYIDDPELHLKETQKMIDVIPIEDSHNVFIAILNHVGKDTVLKWIGELDKEAA